MRKLYKGMTVGLFAVMAGFMISYTEIKETMKPIRSYTKPLQQTVQVVERRVDLARFHYAEDRDFHGFGPFIKASSGMENVPEYGDEEMCLALNIYHEGRGEDVKGQEMIALVTLNRVKSPRWRDTICGVVYQAEQFSWTLEKPYMDLSTEGERKSYRRAIDIARRAVRGELIDTSMGADHYYNPHKVTPSWASVMSEVVVIDRHRFMKDG